MIKMDTKTETNLEEKSIIAGINSQEEPLGSLTFSDIPELKGQQLRSSARVFKKMKQDSTVSVVPEKNEKKEDSKEEKQESKKCFRPLWSSDDKTVFFEALNEYGKDFESIQLYISNKFRKKGVPDQFVKTKDQIRHLYYRTWQKISKYLNFSEGIKKVTQELYGLINYGELRKKVGSVNVKYLVKLNKLIYKGSLTVRVKGKSIRVKTPFCRALRKLNQLDEKYEEIRLPNRLTVEMRPKDMSSFLKVQSTAQNPRLKTYMPLQKRLSTLIDCLSKKWKSVEANIYDKALISTSPITANSVPTEQEIKANKEQLNPLLRITPPPDCKIEVPCISLGEYFTRQSMCFNSYESRLISNYNTYRNYPNYKIINKNTKKGSRSRTDSASEKSPQKMSLQTEDDICDIVAETSNENSKDLSKEAGKKLETTESNPEEIKLQDDKSVIDVDNAAKLEKEERIRALRRGWTIKDSESITLGEIYLMCGSNSKLVLEYSWDPPASISDSDCLTNKSNIDISDSPNYGQNLDLSESLIKLLSVAKLHYRKNIIKCPCGHVCGIKNNAQLKRDVESKIRKILTDIDKCSEDTDEKVANGEHIFENSRTFVKPSVYMQPKIPISSYYQANAFHLASKVDIQGLTPGYCNKKGRLPRSKQVVVERKLPLLPNNIGSGHQIVRMNIISKDNPKTLPDPKTVITTTNIFIPNEQQTGASTSNSDFTLNSKEILAENLNQSNIEIGPSSPARILNEAEHWINSEVEDYSLSSLLGHLESPAKSTTSLMNEDSRMSHDVDAQLHSLLTQNSIDFSANFADLAAEVARDTKCELG